MARSWDLRITLEPDGTVFARRFTRFASDLTDPTGILTQVVERIELIVQEAFATEGARTGSLWAPLSEGYRLWKQRHHPGRQILTATGRMRGSVVGEVRGRRGEIGVGTSYAVYHQHGTRRMPQRQILRLSNENRVEIQRLVHRYLVQHAAGRLAA